MSRSERRTTTPMSLIVTGIVVGALTGLFAANAGFDDGDGGFAILAVGGFVSQILLLVGCVGKGVEMGMRESRD